MSDVKWIKIATDIFDDEKIKLIEQMPDGDAMIVIWFKLLTYCGKSNNNGVFMLGKMAYTDEMLAMLMNRPLMSIRLALKTFESFGMIEIINNVYTIPNWEKHQNTKGLQKMREDGRRRQAEYRARQKAIATGEVLFLEDNAGEDQGEDSTESNALVTDSLLDKNKNKKENKKKNNTYDDDFLRFWDAYPRKVGKSAAQKAFVTRIKEKEVTPDQLVFAAQRYADECKRRRTDEQYIKHASTFLGPQRAYEDYVPKTETEQLPGQMNVSDYPGIVPEPRVLTDAEAKELGYE